MVPQCPLIIRRKLDRLARMLRYYAALDGIAVLLLLIIVLFGVSFALDRFFEFPSVIRLLLLPILAGILACVVWQRIIRRCFTPIRDDQLASALEHFVPRLNGTLITAIERQESKNDQQKTADEYYQLLIQQTASEAVRRLRGVDVRQFFRTGKIIARFAVSILCFTVTAGACAYHSDYVSLWFARNILLSEREYPRKSLLMADGFQEGRARIGRGDSFTLSIRASLDMPLVPESLRVRVGTPDVGYRTLLLDQFRTETLINGEYAGRWRVFSTTFPEMLETVNLYIRGADSALTDLSIEVLPMPTLTEWTLTQHFPKYMQRQERTVSPSSRETIPDGTAVTITAKPTKPLQNATAIILSGGGHTEHNVLAETGTVELILPPLRASPSLSEGTTIEFRLTDIDSLSNRQPIRLEFGMLKDMLPTVTARLDGIGPAITPDAVLPIVGEITDDNGLASATIQYTMQPGKEDETQTIQREPSEGTVPITGISSGQTVFNLAQAFHVSQTEGQPGDQLMLHIEANDAFDLDDDAGQIGRGQRFSLDIVTPEHLKILLETREITLRQRFEIIIGEVERTKNILQSYSFEPTELQIQQAEALTIELNAFPDDETTEEQGEETTALRYRELEEQRQRILETITREQAELGRFHIARMFRDTQKTVYDLTNIIESFRIIRQEMINNRIFTEDQRRRIDIEIMQPMRNLILSDFTDIDRSLEVLTGMLSGDPTVTPTGIQSIAPHGLGKATRSETEAQRQITLRRFEELLQKMSAIRDKMASMENFNEAVELLRSIIRQQQILRNETIEERNQRLRDLLN